MTGFSRMLIGGLTGFFSFGGFGASAYAVGEDLRYGGHMWSDGWGGMFMGGGMMVVFMLIVIVAIVLLVRGMSGGSGSGGNGSAGGRTALDILNERYARGEIDTAEYSERKKAITEGR